MVINGRKLSCREPINVYRLGGDAPVACEPVPVVAGKPQDEPETANWRGMLPRRVRHLPTGKVYDSAQEAAQDLGYHVTSIRTQCAPSKKGSSVFEYADSEVRYKKRNPSFFPEKIF